MVFGRMLFVVIMCGFSGLYAAQTSVPTMPASVTLKFSNGFRANVSINVVRKYAQLEHLAQFGNPEVQVETDLEVNESVFKMLTQLVISRQKFIRQLPYNQNDFKVVMAFAKQFQVSSHDFGGNSINLERLEKFTTK